jgi:hypothetical protein
MTEAGAVFLFKSNLAEKSEEQVLELLKDWQRYGLPQHAGGDSDSDQGWYRSDSWQENPWINSNGFGEIAVDLDVYPLSLDGL